MRSHKNRALPRSGECWTWLTLKGLQKGDSQGKKKRVCLRLEICTERLMGLGKPSGGTNMEFLGAGGFACAIPSSGIPGPSFPPVNSHSAQRSHLQCYLLRETFPEGGSLTTIFFCGTASCHISFLAPILRNTGWVFSTVPPFLF